MLALIAYLAPLAIAAASYVAFSQPGQRPAQALTLSKWAALAALVVSLVCGVLLIQHGAQNSMLIGTSGLGLSVRLDVISVIMLCLVSFVGWVVLRFSATYLDGEPEQGRFTGWMLFTLAAVLLLVSSGNLVQLALGWFGAGYGLHRLLLFYPERLQAQRAARKKELVSRLADVALIMGAALLIWRFGTGDIAQINEMARHQTEANLWPIAGFLALAAILKSAQFPTGGWLTEVMETPTPVSALLHAGIINAGGFLLIRFADVMMTAPSILAVLVMVGGLSALVGGLVMLTQSAVKTALAWSTVAQMGFMILQCGLALFPMALLHIVAHSLYKAHAFLSSGNAVQDVAKTRKPGPVAVPSGGNVLRAFGLAILVYALVGLVFGLPEKAPQGVALGAILIFGVAYLLAQGLADRAPIALTQRTVLASFAAAASYFALQTGADLLTHGTLPPPPQPGPLEWALIVLAVVSFGVVALAQALFPLWAHHPAAQGWRVHLVNGLYANAIFDRLIGGRSTKTSH